VRRDPRIIISGRPCCFCRTNVDVGLIIRLLGQVSGEVFVCKRCFIAAANRIAYGQDAIFNINIERREPGRETKLG